MEERGELSGAVEHQQLEHNVAALADQHLFQDAGEEIGIDVAAGEHRANSFVGLNWDLFGQQSGESGAARPFDYETVVLDAEEYRPGDLFFADLDDLVNQLADYRQRHLARIFYRDAVGNRLVDLNLDRVSGIEGRIDPRGVLRLNPDYASIGFQGLRSRCNT